MYTRQVTVPELFLIAATRAAFGAGVGLLLADRLTKDQRKAIGWTLVGVGAISTIPLAAQVVFANRDHEEEHDDAIEPSPELASYPD